MTTQDAATARRRAMLGVPVTQDDAGQEKTTDAATARRRAMLGAPAADPTEEKTSAA